MNDARQIIEQHRIGAAAHLGTQFARAGEGAVGHGDFLRAFGREIRCHQFNHFTCADEQDIQIGDFREDLFGHFHRSGSHRHRAVAHSGVAAHFFGDGKGFLE